MAAHQPAQGRLALAAALLGVPLAEPALAGTPSFVSPFPNVENGASPACADLDGDLDAFIGDSYGNTFFFENVELGPGSCADGLDNDFDGDVDTPSDPGCDGPADTSERGSDVCDNGADDDADGLTDFPEDLGCQSPQDDSEWTVLGPSCASSQLHALAGLCSAQLRCHAHDVKRPSASGLDQCLSESQSKLSSKLTKQAAASVKAGEVCPTDQAAASASDLEAFALGLAGDVLEGANLQDRPDAVLRAAITRDASVLCKSDLRTLAREIRKPSVDHGDAALFAARERFLRSTGKAIQRARKAGVSYDGLPPNGIADALRTLAEELADQLSPRSAGGPGLCQRAPAGGRCRESQCARELLGARR